MYTKDLPPSLSRSQLSKTPTRTKTGRRSLAKLEGSATKYQHLPRDDSSSDSDGDDDNTTKPPVGETGEEIATVKKVPTYVDLDFVGASQAAGKPATQSGGESQNYAKLDYSKLPARSPPSPPSPPLLPPHTPQVAEHIPKRKASIVEI